MKAFIVIVLGLLLASGADARTIDVLIYVNKATVGITEDSPSTVKKKGEYPDLKNALLEAEIITHFYKLAEQGGKAFWHCLVERSEDNSKQFSRIKAWIDAQNVGKPINQQILYWSGDGATAVWTNFVKARNDDPFIMTLVKKLVKYPIRSETGNEDHPALATIEEAEDTYGLTITWSKAVIPHKFYGRD